MSYNFKYVNRADYMPVKNELIELIKDVQDEVRDSFTFKFVFIGSSSRNMITCDESMNIGYDFDVDIEPNDDEENYSAKELRVTIINAFNKHCVNYGYGTCQESSRVFTIKKINQKKSKILHSVDFAIISNGFDDNGDDFCQYIHYYKNNQTYSWQEQTSGYYELPAKIDYIKSCECWQDVRDTYLGKKNNNIGLKKKSRSLFAESVNEVANQNGYHEE